MAYYYENMSGATDSKYVNASMKVKRNRLRYVNDGTNYDANDIDPGMASTNYGYDAEGRLAVDVQEKITRITWRVDGKIRKIERPAGATQKNLIFDYDALGHRIAKHVYSSNNVWEKSTYYILDAQGNTMAVYDHINDNTTHVITFTQTEKHIYGSSRLGTNTKAVPLFGSQNATYAMRSVVHYTGKRSYELNNHLGNVLSVISDKVIPHQNGSSVDYWLADIRQSSDYSPFGVLLKNRDLPLTSGSGNVPYRYGFNGMEMDNEIHPGGGSAKGNSYDFGARMLDPRLGRWLTIDPMAIVYPSLSPYNFVGNSPMIFIDPDGEKIKFAKSLSREDKKQYKCELRYLRENSPTFRAIYKDLKRSKNIYTLGTTEVKDDDQYDIQRKEISINFNGNSKGIASHLVIAHEVGHAWRDLMDLDIKEEDSPYCYDSHTTEGTMEQQVFISKKSFSTEFEGLHIENVVRSELGEPLRDVYDVKTDFIVKDQDKKSENVRPDFNKILALVIISKDGNYDYEKEANHYENLLKRKWDIKEIDVNKYDEDKYTKSNH